MNFIKKNTFTFLLGMSIIMLTAYTVKENTTPKASQLMMVEIIFGFENNVDVSGIYTTNNDGKTNKDQELIGYVGQENISINAGKIHKYLKDTYNAGWKLESATGGDNAKRYVFRK